MTTTDSFSSSHVYEDIMYVCTEIKPIHLLLFTGKMEMGFMQGGYSIAAAAGLGLLMVVLLWRSLLQRRKTSNLPPGMVSSTDACSFCEVNTWVVTLCVCVCACF